MSSLRRLVPIFVLLAILFIMLACLFLIKDTPPLTDELRYLPTIREIAKFNVNKETFERGAQLPGYQLIMAAVASIFGFSSLLAMRVTTTIFSFFSVIVFYLVAKKINPQEAILKTCQYFFFPLFFVFFFLVYTDIFSLLLLLSSFLAVVHRRYKIAGLMGLLSIFVRQNNIVWLGFFCLYILAEEYKFRLGVRGFISYLKNISFFVISFFFIIVFLFLNRGPAIGEQGANPFTFRQENFFLFLFLFFFLFLPNHLSNLTKIFMFLRKYPFYLILLAGVFVFYLIFFKVDHLYNLVHYNFYLRNKLVNFAVENLTTKTIFFIPIALSLISLPFFAMSKKSHYLLYPFTFLFLSLSWLIEPRYTIVPFAFLILFKKSQSVSVELITIVIYFLLTIEVFWGTFTQAFFW